jgi:cell wall-associated NlpC family hydrolase
MPSWSNPYRDRYVSDNGLVEIPGGDFVEPEGVEAVCRRQVIEEAESWIGTPFHHEARIKGGGVDCGQLLIAVYGSLGYMPTNYQLEHYPPDFALHRDREWYLSIVESFAQRISAPESGDVVLFKWGRLFSHGGIVTEWPEIIHAWAATGLVGRFRADMNPLAEKPKLFFSPFNIQPVAAGQ